MRKQMGEKLLQMYREILLEKYNILAHIHQHTIVGEKVTWQMTLQYVGRGKKTTKAKKEWTYFLASLW